MSNSTSPPAELGVSPENEWSFPVKVGPDLTHNGHFDGFVAKLNPSGKTLLYCGYVGGAHQEYAGALVVDAAGYAYLTGSTQSDQSTFPVKAGPGLIHGGGSDAFVTKISLIALNASGTPRPGGTVALDLTATGDAGLLYQAGSSLGTGPISIDSRILGLSADDLLLVSARNLCPWIFSGFRGTLDNQCRARAVIRIPDIQDLIGVRLHTAFVTLSPAATSGVKSISDTVSFSITK